MDDRITELAHELRTPLTGVLGAIDLVSDPPVPLDEAEIAELLAVARSEANQLRSIIDGVVQRTRLDAGTLTAERQPVPVVEVVEVTLARFPDVSDRTAVTGDPSLVASTDRSLVEQILTNLIQNIARYAPAGAVSVTMERQGEVVRIRVSDSGPGLPGGEVPSSQGLGVGLTTSRRLAETVGGSLRSVPTPSGSGAAFELELPASDETMESSATPGYATTLPPRARLLQEVADLLVGTSVERILSGVGKLGREMLGAATTRVFEMRRDTVAWLKEDGEHQHFDIDDDTRILLGKANGTVTLVDRSHPWLVGLTAAQLLAVTMRSPDGLAGMLVVGWSPGHMPPFAGEVLPALAALALVGIDRRSLGAELEFERQVRAEVLDSLPIAISVFAGEPLRLISTNEAERRLLGVGDDDDHPEALVERQERFSVRFEDGTPLTVDNAPVVETIRTGRSTGPFYLRILRLDGTEVVTRTYCAPVCDAHGAVIGAVVTSEPIGG